MKKNVLKDFGFYFGILAAWAFAAVTIPHWVGARGWVGEWLETGTLLKFFGIWIFMSHLCISAMSIAFHRAHTHQAVRLSRGLDYLMQAFLWITTSMSKLDWVSVHVYHHAHSDTPEDPHSPSQKGLARVFFLGVLDYSRAKSEPEVLKIRNRIPATAFERYIAAHLFQGPVAMGLLLMFLLGPSYGTMMTFMIFMISPVFAVGGVNALAHAVGYQNYDSKDESRNLGFLFPLNWVICGELDHNNHHKFPKSPSFGHRWFEFDIGWVYLRLFRLLGLAEVNGKVPDYRKDPIPPNSQSEVAFVS
ncbi:hypothetical protein EB061_00020 [bacterium]|jgi:stearoyl-CoA desaturase (delta-9 desaturase)|nr:hypothetical protein [bacterium]